MTGLEHIAVAGLVMGGLGTTLAALLGYANRKLHVYEDPRIDALEHMLPGTNCGACGTAGCRAFAEALTHHRIEPAQCTVATPEERQAIADFLGVEVGEAEKRVARLACAGGNNVAWNSAHYDGLATCRAAALVDGGGKGCAWGCLGFGDCATVCDYDAIVMSAHGLPEVIEDKCTACGDCVEVCPKHLFSIHPVSHRLWVACANRDATDTARAVCALACDACGRCVADAPAGLIEIKGDLAVVDYATATPDAARAAIERCPTGAIVWYDERGRANKGRVAAHKPVHKEALALGERP
jgi:RnfABCDGE-type electron transport complex B subunit